MIQSGGLFITGTDTGIGKTQASCALINAFQSRGLRAVGMKPVASGCELIDGEWRNEDALALIAASASKADYALINPYALPMATAPQLATLAAGVSIELPSLVQAYQQLAATVDRVVVEGVGGWLAPLSRDLDQSDLVQALNVPVVLVVGMRLGCINHARLSERSILFSGHRLLGWLANYPEAGFDADGDYRNALGQSMQTPLLGNMAFDGKLLLTHAAECLF